MLFTQFCHSYFYNGLSSDACEILSNCRAVAPGVLEKDLFRFQMMLQHVMKMTRTWDSTMSMLPKGGDTIWGGLDWSPEEDYCHDRRDYKHNDTKTERRETKNPISQENIANYGRIISFGQEAAHAAASELKRIDFRVRFLINLTYLPIGVVSWG